MCEAIGGRYALVTCGEVKVFLGLYVMKTIKVRIINPYMFGGIIFKFFLSSLHYHNSLSLTKNKLNLAINCFFYYNELPYLC
jgi:putative Ca2+/H+ antiporter (TMEM165/GDT1 family)